MTAEQATERMLQLASMNMSLSTQPATAKGNGESYAANTPGTRPPAERDFRDLESRFGVTGSSLSIKF